MSNFYDDCDPDIKRNADSLIHKIKTHEKMKRIAPNTSVDFSEEEAFKRFDALTKSEEYDKIIRKAYEC